MKLLFLLIFFQLLISFVVADPFIVGGVAIVGGLAGWLGYQFKKPGMPCSGELKNVDNFRNEFHNELVQTFFGQHIAYSMVGQAIQQHIESSDPKKALALAFLGGTGRGKTFLTTLLAKTLFVNGEKSPYYHKYIGVDRLLDDEIEARTFARNLVSSIRESLTKCAYNVFVFDEMDKFPRVVIDSLLEFIDYDAKTYGDHNSRKSIFVFLSNSATRIIDGEVYKHIYVEQTSRNSLRYEHLKTILREAAFNDGSKFSGLRQSEIVRKSLINYYIPFLPLQRSHVLQCINAFITNHNANKKKNELRLNNAERDRIVNELEYSPEENPVFSKQGCKTVEEVVTTASFRY